MTSSAAPRTPTAVDAVADEFFDRSVALSPLLATELGLPVGQDRYDDLSPAGHEERAELARETLRRLEAVAPADEIDAVTLDAMRERLGLDIERHDAGLPLMQLNNLDSPMQWLRDCLDLMPTDTDEQWATIAARLRQIPLAVEQYAESLRLAAANGLRAARRQVEAVLDQCVQHTADDGYFRTLLRDAQPSAAVREDLRAGVDAAIAGYQQAAGILCEEFLDRAPVPDGVGRERYRLESRYFLGAKIDLEETYAWGQEELARITGMMQHTAGRIEPGASIAEAITALNSDPAYRLHGTDELQGWMQGKADEAVEVLGRTHFDIPEPVRRIECLIAPTHLGGIYYTGPSDDFTRPGRMWWSVPKGVTEFGTWKELSTVYHEGVPGHHLQIGQTAYRAELLNKWRRMMCWTSGHGEGWALYAEWLMADLGYMDDPGNLMGLLDGQSLRAARVVLDIGFHCGFAAPASVGGGQWTYDKAWAFLTAHANMDEGFLRFELDRYLGWPGQAPSYKLGERLWLELRDECRRREGAAFDLTGFHRRALDIGSVGLDTLRNAVLGTL